MSKHEGLLTEEITNVLFVGKIVAVVFVVVVAVSEAFSLQEKFLNCRKIVLLSDSDKLAFPYKSTFKVG